MNQNQRPQPTHMASEIDLPAPAIDEDMKDSVEFGGGTDWESLTNTFSWDPESALMNVSGTVNDPFLHYSVCLSDLNAKPD